MRALNDKKSERLGCERGGIQVCLAPRLTIQTDGDCPPRLTDLGPLPGLNDGLR